MPDWNSENPPWLPKKPAHEDIVRHILASAASETRHDLPRPSPTPPPDEQHLALKLQQCVTQGRALLARKPFNRATATQLLRRIRSVLLPLFGKQAPLVKYMTTTIMTSEKSTLPLADFTQNLDEAEALAQHLQRIADRPSLGSGSLASPVPVTKRVFIIHGHDELNTRRLSNMLQNEFHLTPVAMLAKPGMSRPLAEKFEAEAQTCSFAVALFTPDDAVSTSEGQQRQARPNVIYETGWFIGRLGRERVLLLLRDGTRIHSDLDGVSQVRFAENIEEKFLDIKRELTAASLTF